MSQSIAANPLFRGALRLLVRALIGVVGLGAALGLLLVILPDGSEALGRTTGWCAVTAIHLALMIAATQSLRRRSRRIAVLLVYVTCLGAMAGWSLLISGIARGREEETMAGLGGVCSALSVAGVHGLWMLCLPTKSILLRIMASGVVIMVYLLAAIIIAAIVFGESFFGLMGMRSAMFILGLVYGLGLFSLLGTVLVPTLVWTVNRRARASVESVDDLAQIEMDCPACGAAQKLASGPAWCRSCKFAMMIEIEEPRCACGYLLYRLVGNQCPECGRELQPTKPPGEAAADAASATA